MTTTSATRAHFDAPRNVGRFPPATPGVAEGVAGSPETGDMIRIGIRLAEGQVVEARFQAFGCAWAIACASLLTERLSGLSESAAMAIESEELARTLDLGHDQLRYAALALAAARAALQDLHTRKEIPA